MTWTAEGNPDQTWSGSGYAKWGGINPGGYDLVFDAAGTSSSATTVTSVIDSDVSATSLLFHYNSATQYHVLQINAGATLSLAGAIDLFRVGGYAESNVVTNTHAAITGSGALSVQQDGGTFWVGNNNMGSGMPAHASLDMSGLARLNVDLGAGGAFNVATGTTPTNVLSQGSAIVRLAGESSLTAGILRVGSNNINTQLSLGSVESAIYLGQKNTLNFDTVHVGRGVASSATGAIRFDSSALLRFV